MKKDLLNQVKWLLDRCKADYKGNLHKMREATGFYVYASFSIRLMRKEFPSDAAFKDFIISYLPECLGDWKTMVAIGQHFKYDEQYLNFLDENGYATTSAQRKDVTKIGVQLKEVAIKCRKAVDSPKQLQDLFESDLVPETTAANDKPKSEQSRPYNGPETPLGDQEGAQPKPKPEEDEAKPEPEKVDPNAPSPADINFNKQLNSLVYKVQNFSSHTDGAFRDLLRLRPVSGWDTIRAGYLKEALAKVEALAKTLSEIIP